MQFAQHSARQSVTLRVARLFVAALLVLALLSASAPTGSLASVSASECSMSCCVGLPKHAAGECAGVSCHAGLSQTGDAHDAHQDDADAPADAHAAHRHETPLQAPSRQHSHSAQHDAQASDAPHASHAAPSGEHHASGADEQHRTTGTPPAKTNTPRASESDRKASRNRRPTALAASSVAKPCPPECGTAAVGFGNGARSRDAATLAGTHRTRPPTRAATRKHAPPVPLDSADKHRLAPPRAPPSASLSSMPA